MRSRTGSRCRAGAETAFRSDDLERAADRVALAAILDARGRHEEARVILQETLVVVEAVLGPDHYEVAVTIDALAEVTQRVGDREEAIALHRRALRIKQRLLGRDHVQVKETLERLARLLDSDPGPA
jgi:tetratricopeptide (TPR) repeat protein